MQKSWIILILLVLASCNDVESVKRADGHPGDSGRRDAAIVSNATAVRDTIHHLEDKIQLVSFTELPEEIDGGSCTFFLSTTDEQNGAYVFANDLAQVAFVAINGKMTKFVLKGKNEKDSGYLYTNGVYYIKVNAHGVKASDTERSDDSEYERQEGTIQLIKGRNVLFAHRLIGSCGC